MYIHHIYDGLTQNIPRTSIVVIKGRQPMDKFKSYGLIAVIFIVVLLATYVQFSDSGNDKEGTLTDSQYTELALKTSFNVGDKHSYYDSVGGKESSYVITGVSMNNDNMYTVDHEGQTTNMSYDDLKRVIAPDLDFLKEKTRSFNKTGTTVMTIDGFGDIQCDQYRAVYGNDTEEYLYIDYCITPSGVIIKMEGIIPKGGLHEYCLVLDKTTMVMKTESNGSHFLPF